MISFALKMKMVMEIRESWGESGRIAEAHRESPEDVKCLYFICVEKKDESLADLELSKKIK
jgi:hypothetical protein